MNDGRCESTIDTYTYTTSRGNVLVLKRCVLAVGHSAACDETPCERAPFCEHRHTDGDRRGWPTANEWHDGDANQGDLWDRFARAVSALPHE